MLVKDLLVDAVKAEDGVARAKKYLAKPKPVPLPSINMMPGAMFPVQTLQEATIRSMMMQQQQQAQLSNQAFSLLGQLGTLGGFR